MLSYCGMAGVARGRLVPRADTARRAVHLQCTCSTSQEGLQPLWVFALLFFQIGTALMAVVATRAFACVCLLVLWAAGATAQGWIAATDPEIKRLVDWMVEGGAQLVRGE